ncbi:MAG: DUF512 domain-containing protein, partial [Gemmatimonadota bacterium]
MAERSHHWAYGADELYLRADLSLPPAEVYEDFDQVENGVGSVRFLQREVAKAKDRFTAWRGRRIGVLTGTSMARLMPEVLAPLAEASGAHFDLISVVNSLFGPRVTTAGLLPGRALLETLRGRFDLDLALLPGESVNDRGLFIDDLTLEALQAGVSMPVILSKTFSDALEETTR